MCVLGCQRGRKMKSTHHKNAFLCISLLGSFSARPVIIIHEATLFRGSIALLPTDGEGSEMGRDGLLGEAK